MLLAVQFSLNSLRARERQTPPVEAEERRGKKGRSFVQREDGARAVFWPMAQLSARVLVQGPVSGFNQTTSFRGRLERLTNLPHLPGTALPPLRLA